MALTVWNPFRELDDLLSRMQRGHIPTSQSNQPAIFVPAVDISETPKEYLVKAELPGIKKEELKISVDNGVLTLSGERKSEKEDKDEKHHRMERYYGSFERSFSLPDDAMANKIAADYKDGIVSIHIPKTDIKKATKMEVKIQ